MVHSVGIVLFIQIFLFIVLFNIHVTLEDNVLVIVCKHLVFYVNGKHVTVFLFYVNGGHIKVFNCVVC